MILEGDPVHGGGRIDLRTGEVWPQSAIEYAEEVGEIDEDDDPDRWLWVHCEGSHDGYRDMECACVRSSGPGTTPRRVGLATLTSAGTATVVRVGMVVTSCGDCGSASTRSPLARRGSLAFRR